MNTARLEAFSDGVLAIIITIMVLELRAPHSAEWSALRPLLPALSSYLLSFVYIGIYWNNHHHMLHVTDRVTGGILWANLHLLFWLTLVPTITAWMGENRFAPVPVAVYGLVLLLAGSRTTSCSARSSRARVRTPSSPPPWGGTGRARPRRSSMPLPFRSRSSTLRWLARST